MNWVIKEKYCHIQKTRKKNTENYERGLTKDLDPKNILSINWLIIKLFMNQYILLLNIERLDHSESNANMIYMYRSNKKHTHAFFHAFP